MITFWRITEGIRETITTAKFGKRYLWFLELPDRNNANDISNIPEDIVYQAVPYNSPSHGKCFLVKGVPNRSYIEFHKGNFYVNTNGCILPGLDIGEINNDGFYDVLRSKDALDFMFETYPNGFDFIIKKLNI